MVNGDFEDPTLAGIGSDDLHTPGGNVVEGSWWVHPCDLGILLSAWGPCSGCAADLNGSGAVDGADLGLLLSRWTAS